MSVPCREVARSHRRTHYLDSPGLAWADWACSIWDDIRIVRATTTGRNLPMWTRSRRFAPWMRGRRWNP